MAVRTVFTLFLSILAISRVYCQPTVKFDAFEIVGEDLYWRNTYNYNGHADSLRREVVQMLKSKFFTFM